MLLISCPLLSNASAYWLEIIGKGKMNEQVTIQLIYGNIDDAGIRHRQTGTELILAGEFTFTLVSPSGKETAMQLTKSQDCLETSFLPNEMGTYRILGINKTHPVVDRSAIGGENILPIDYLCAQYLVGSASTHTKPSQFLDILTQQVGKVIRITAFRNEKPETAKTKLRIFNPENWEKELSLNEKGEARFVATMKGRYNIRLDWIDKIAGNYNGISYTSIRYRCNYCLFIN